MDEPTLNQDEIDSLLSDFGGDSGGGAPAPDAGVGSDLGLDDMMGGGGGVDTGMDLGGGGGDDLSALMGGGDMGGAPAAAPAAAPARAAGPSADTSGFPQRNIDVLLDVPLEMVVELGRSEMQVKDVLDLASGSVVELDRMTSEPINVLVNGKLVARGEVVVVDESFGVRISHIVSPMERLAQLK